MGVGEDFSTFCANLAVPATVRSVIADRYRLITRRLNIDFWNVDSGTAHSFYTGSYGRSTAVGATSDVDMVMELPNAVYRQFDQHAGNGQSALLQSVRQSIAATYPSSAVGADGQVVIVPFSDGIRFEVLPGFLNTAGSYNYPDSNAGGKWKTANPKPEIAAIDQMDQACNRNLKMLCRMARAWKAKWDVPISGLLIDTLAYSFIRSYTHRDKSFLYYDFMSRDFFDFLRAQDSTQQYWLSPGAGQYVWRTGNFEYKSTRCYNIATEACSYQGDKYGWTARRKWREIYGTDFPG